jgi:hypothetical protein
MLYITTKIRIVVISVTVVLQKQFMSSVRIMSTIYLNTKFHTPSSKALRQKATDMFKRPLWNYFTFYKNTDLTKIAHCLKIYYHTPLSDHKLNCTSDSIISLLARMLGSWVRRFKSRSRHVLYVC